MGITCPLLPYNYGNITLPIFKGNFYGDFAHYYYKINLNCSLIITLNSHFGSFTTFMHLREVIYEFTLPEHYLIVREEMVMFSLYWNHVYDRSNDL